MSRSDTDLIMVCTCDVAGQLRGKAMPRLAVEHRREIGVGWTPTNVFITSFGPIAPSPWGALGDLFIRPDFSTQVDVVIDEFGVDESFVLGDVMDLSAEPWTCCLRGQLAHASRRLEQRHGLKLRASFEHEFHYSGSEAQPGLGYALRAFRRFGEFPNRFMAVLDAAGLSIDTFMPEYGPGQCEATLQPQPAVRAADEAVILREMARATARGLDARASFAPILDPAGVGNGLHVHFSLEDLEGQPVCHDPTASHGVSAQAGRFVAGILRRLPELIAMTAPTVASYLRLTPHRWSAAFNNFGKQDREAAVRICPVFPGGPEKKRQFHFEFRASDGAANPYLVLASLINGGIDGLDDELATPPVTESDLAAESTETLADIGCVRLPKSLDTALRGLTESQWAREAFGATLIDVFDRHKRAEIEVMAGLSAEEICRRYAQAY